MPTYTVLVDDNFHHMGEGEQYKLGDFDTCQAALDACKQVIDDCLLYSLQPPKSEQELWNLFRTFGDSPILLPRDPNCPFSAWDYAKQRCKDLTQPNG